MDVLTEPGQQAGRNVNASEDSPRYEVCITGHQCLTSGALTENQIENLNTGKTTTIYEANIIGVE